MGTISITAPKVRGVNREHAGLLDVEVGLTPAPDAAWLEIFNRRPPGFEWSMSMHSARAAGNSVALTPPDTEIDRYMESLKRQVAATNDYYQQVVAPEIEEERQRELDAKEEERRRIAEAQERLDGTDDSSAKRKPRS